MELFKRIESDIEELFELSFNRAVLNHSSKDYLQCEKSRTIDKSIDTLLEDLQPELLNILAEYKYDFKRRASMLLNLNNIKITQELKVMSDNRLTVETILIWTENNTDYKFCFGPIRRKGK